MWNSTQIKCYSIYYYSVSMSFSSKNRETFPFFQNIEKKINFSCIFPEHYQQPVPSSSHLQQYSPSVRARSLSASPQLETLETSQTRTDFHTAPAESNKQRKKANENKDHIPRSACPHTHTHTPRHASENEQHTSRMIIEWNSNTPNKNNTFFEQEQAVTDSNSRDEQFALKTERRIFVEKRRQGYDSHTHARVHYELNRCHNIHNKWRTEWYQKQPMSVGSSKIEREFICSEDYPESERQFRAPRK